MKTKFQKVIRAVENTYNTLDCSGGALIVYHNNQLEVEQYWGTHSKGLNSRPIQPDTKFHIASCRKSYVGFALAYAVSRGFIQSIDDEISLYLPANKQNEILNGTTIRHLMTHSHGLSDKNGFTERDFPAGRNWGYQGINVELVSEIIRNTMNRTIAEIVTEEVFIPLNFTETNWYNTFDDTFVEVIRKDYDRHWITPQNIDGSKMNMYASTRELAQWGLLHLNNGSINGKQIIDPSIIQLATQMHNPSYENKDLPENGFFWFVKGSQANRSEIGEQVPIGAYQILGYTTVTLLVIPSERIVAVRAFNSFGNPTGYDYLRDVKDFGNAIVLDLS